MEKKSLVSRFGLGLAGVVMVFAASCGGSQQDTHDPGSGSGSSMASADLQSKSGSTMKGTAKFKSDGKTVTVDVTVEGGKAGEHAIHIHEVGDCSAPDAKSAGEHWNPKGLEHGRWETPSHHLGDIGNLTVDDGGKGTLSFSTDQWQLGTGAANDVVGKSVIVHEKVDDFTTQPSGNAGDRVVCGVITKL